MRKKREVLKHEPDAALMDVRVGDFPAGQEYLSGIRDSNPAMERNSVVLPDPLGPNSATYSPRSTANVTSPKAR
jgi:hypothetical protein